jgi:hypothetical protein
MDIEAASGTTEDSGWSIALDEAEGNAEVLERWTSLAPLKDVVVVNDDGGAMVRVMPIQRAGQR